MIQIEDRWIRTLGATLEEYEQYMIVERFVPLKIRFRWWRRRMRDRVRWS